MAKKNLGKVVNAVLGGAAKIIGEPAQELVEGQKLNPAQLVRVAKSVRFMPLAKIKWTAKGFDKLAGRFDKFAAHMDDFKELVDDAGDFHLDQASARAREVAAALKELVSELWTVHDALKRARGK